MKTVYIFLFTNPRGGAWRRQVEALHYFEEHKITSHLYVYEGDDLYLIDNLKFVNVHKIKPSFLGKSIFDFTFQVFIKLFPFIKHSHSNKFIMIAVGGNANIVSALLKKVIKKNLSLKTFMRGGEYAKMIIRAKKTHSTQLGIKFKIFIHKRIYSIILKNSDLLMTQTEHGMKIIHKLYPKSIPKKTAILPNNLNTSWMKKNLEQVLNNKQYEVIHYDDTFRIGFVGRINIHVKGVDNLLKAIKKTEDDKIHLDIVGNGEMDKLNKMITDLDMESQVTVHGYKDNPMEVTINSDIIVVPSRVDPMPNTVLEGLAMNKIVIGAKVDGIKVMLYYDDLLYEVEDTNRLKNLIVEIKKDPDFKNHLLDLCKKRAARYNFDWGKKFYSLVN